MTYPFLKGHGTENDFVLLPDSDGSVHGDLDAERVRALCDRRAGIGGDGVLRVVRREGAWFMDYRNADGSVSEMCGNGIRVFARYLAEREGESFPMIVATRDGAKTITEAADGRITVDMGTPKVLGRTSVTVESGEYAAQHVSMGNPHAVAFVADLDLAGPLLIEPGYDKAVYPSGVNVEFVVRRGERHVEMRVHERGSGETRSCGTGACAVMVAAALADEAPRGTTYLVDVPGGRLEIEWTSDDRILMTGPGVLVAEGRWALPSANAATVLAKQIGGVLSHRSAATWWGWEQKSADHLADVTLPRNRTVPSELRGQVTPHWADLTEAEIDWGRTSPERTMVDCLRSLPFDEALAMADSAVRADDFTQAQLVALVSGLRGPGARQARRVAALATSKSANPFESVLRAIALDVPGLNVMAQCPVTLVSGREIHPDLGDPVLFVAIEAEGLATHGKRAALRRDCRRYNDLARVGWVVLRFTWDDVMFRPDDVRAVLIDVVAVRAAA